MAKKTVVKKSPVTCTGGPFNGSTLYLSGMDYQTNTVYFRVKSFDDRYGRYVAGVWEWK